MDPGERRWSAERQPLAQAHEEHRRVLPDSGQHQANTRIAQQDGILHLVPWDYDFTDNEGYYRVIFRITLAGAGSQ